MSVDPEAVRSLLINTHVGHDIYGRGIILAADWSDDGNPLIKWIDPKRPGLGYTPLRELTILGVFTQAEADRYLSPPEPLALDIIEALALVAWRNPPENQQVVMLNDAGYVAQRLRDEATAFGERRIAALEAKLAKALDGRTIVDDHQLCFECEAALKKIIANGIEAFRLTREYANGSSLPDHQLLPSTPGWAWYDWCETARTVLD